MNNFTPDFLKGVAVRVASQFLTNKKPLSSGVAEVATEYSLNNEQIKRLIEVVNQVTYLKLLPTADDRTFEFELAKYEDVLSLMTSPDPESLTMTDDTLSPIEIAAGAASDGLAKVASEEEAFDVGSQEKIAYLNKMVYSTRNQLEKIAEREVTLLDEIQKVVPQCREDESFMSKVAMVTDGDEDLITKIARLVYDSSKEWSTDGLFYEEELAQAKTTVGLLKEATELLKTKSELEEQLEKAAAIMPALNAAKNAIGSNLEKGKKQ